MNRRSIALGASVIAVGLAGPGSAEAEILGELGEKLPQTGVTAKVQADVKTNVSVAPELSSTKSGSSPKHAGGPLTDPGAKAGIGGQAAAGGSGFAARAELEQTARLKGTANGAKPAGRLRVAGEGGAKLDSGRRHGRAITKGKRHVKHAAKAKSRAPSKPAWSAPTAGHPKSVVPLRGIGREVGNPIQLSLAGWLIALTGAACLGTSALVRRLQRTRL